MRIAIGADHFGLDYKNGFIARLVRDFDVFDVGADYARPVEYADFAYAVGAAVASGGADRGIIICASGSGASMSCNKLHGVRCVAPTDLLVLERARRELDANVLALDARLSSWEAAERLVLTFLAIPFERSAHAEAALRSSAFDDEQRLRTARDLTAGKVDGRERRL